MQKTSKLGLNKPDLTDYVSIADLNENADILDEALGGLQNGSTVIEELQTESKELAGAINELVNKTKLPGAPINTEVTNLKQKLADLERKIGDLDGLLQEEEKADLVALIRSIKQQLTTHLADKVKHITSEERIDWNQKETIEGAQKKANNAESNVKQWVNLQKGAVNGLAELDENGRVKNKDGSVPSDWILINDINVAGRNAIELHIEELSAYRRLELVLIGIKAGNPGSSGQLSLYINSIPSGNEYTYQQTTLSSGNVANYAFYIALGNVGQDTNDFPRIVTIYNDHMSTRAIPFDSVYGSSRAFGSYTGATVPLHKLILKSLAKFTEGRVIVRGILT